jgi:hypothetical protein
VLLVATASLRALSLRPNHSSIKQARVLITFAKQLYLSSPEVFVISLHTFSRFQQASLEDMTTRMRIDSSCLPCTFTLPYDELPYKVTLQGLVICLHVLEKDGKVVLLVGTPDQVESGEVKAAWRNAVDKVLERREAEPARREAARREEARATANGNVKRIGWRDEGLEERMGG